MKQVEMIALRRFRLQEGQALVWKSEGEPYSIPSNQVEFHETTKRGKRVKPKGTSK